jgi:PIN domain nuclease of toxin-antitoxin system
VSDATYVLDASAVLAFLFNETGGARVEGLLGQGGCELCAVNLCEVLCKLADRACPPEVATALRELDIRILPFDAETADEAARMRGRTRERGLSLGHVACLATGALNKAQVVTADHAWEDLSVDVRMVIIR